MFRISRKIAAVLLAIWLPLFSGSALAASVAMQAMDGECTTIAGQADEHVLHHASTPAERTDHSSFATTESHTTEQGDHHEPPCKNCGVCHLACSGYLAAVGVEMVQIQSLAQLFTPSSTKFQSVVSAPLVPPPLARV
ncbi:MAG: DUF2946 domain-containing protein [Gallionella sp.]|nr:DUF2946 domain-containing protein [Gallionella sp.]